MVSLEEIEKDFAFTVNLEIESFLDVYKDELEIEIKKEANYKEKFKAILNYFKKNKNKKLMILIDEYDHFTNRLFLKDIDSYKEAVKKENAFYKEFFTLLKAGAS